MRLESNRVQNEGMRRNSHGNSKERMNWVLVSRYQSMDQFWVVNIERTMCSQDLRELPYNFNLYSLVLFFAFLD